MKTYILIFFILGFENLAFSQNDKIDFTKNSIGLQLGYNAGYLKDVNFSALNYKEGGLLYSLKFEHHPPNEKEIIDAEFNFCLGTLKTKASDNLTSASTMANFEFSYLRKLIQKRAAIYLGAQYNSYLQILDWQGYESFSFLSTHGIGFKGLLSYPLSSKHKFTSSLFIPVFQNLVRPPYNGIDEKIIENQDNISLIIFDGQPASFNQYFAFDWKLNYLFSLSKKFDLSATYLLRYQKTSEINEITHLQNQLSVGLNFKFGS